MSRLHHRHYNIFFSTVTSVQHEKKVSRVVQTPQGHQMVTKSFENARHGHFSRVTDVHLIECTPCSRPMNSPHLEPGVPELPNLFPASTCSVQHNAFTSLFQALVWKEFVLFLNYCYLCVYHCHLTAPGSLVQSCSGFWLLSISSSCSSSVCTGFLQVLRIPPDSPKHATLKCSWV